jgi:hypothetical protein
VVTAQILNGHTLIKTVILIFVAVSAGFASANVASIIGEISFPLPYPLDEGHEQTSRHKIYDSIGYIGALIGLVTGLIFMRKPNSQSNSRSTQAKSNG